MVDMLHDVDRKKPEEFNVIVECPKGTRQKYEIDKETGLVKFDRIVHCAMIYSTNYSYIPQTHWEDGDPIDVLVMSEEPFVPGCLVKCRPIGKMEMDDCGESDTKILAVPVKDPRFDHIQDIGDVSEHFLEEQRHFFTHYKDLKKPYGVKVKVGKWEDKKVAIEAIQQSFDLYDKKYKK